MKTKQGFIRLSQGRCAMNKIPELLKTVSGEKIASVEDWERFRRPEIMNLMAEYIYGVRPCERPDGLKFEVVKEIRGFGEENILHRKIKISVGDFALYAYGYIPEGSGEKVPAFVYIMHEYQEDRCDLENSIECINVDIRGIIARGRAVFIMPTRPLGLDEWHRAGYTQGIFPVIEKDVHSRKSDAWATISAWAWGASRVLDYLETDEHIDSKRVTAVGHSRGGKTALWSGATDTRFACAISNDSGCAGAAMHRTTKGERISDINKLAPTWFCENYHNFDGREEMLPTDQHMLIAAMAPRLVYVASSTEDSWADPEAERLSCRLASEAWELYGTVGAVLPDEPVDADKAYHGGSVGYHMKTGEHSITHADWAYYLDFLDKNHC